MTRNPIRHPMLPLLIAALLHAPLLADTASPNVLLITVDTLRADRVSAYGYERPTTPNIDAIIRAGARFDQARTPEPLTAPAMCSMITGVHPQVHGASRNGLRMHDGLDSVTKRFRRAGYHTAAFVSNWTLRDKLSGLAEHFETYEEVLTRSRWFGFIRREADAGDVREAFESWLDRPESESPWFAWVHFIEPHAPYRDWDGYRERLGLPARGKLPPADRYDTEIAFVDEAVGALLDHVPDRENVVIVFAADHGESLGEHDYWGHGRNLYEPGLHIPLALSWPGRIEPQVIDAPASLLDVAPTLIALVDLPAEPEAEEAGGTTDGAAESPNEVRHGFDWTPVLLGGPAPTGRVMHFQAHKGAVLTRHDSNAARRAGLLEVGRLENGVKEIFRVPRQRMRIFDLAADPGELAEDLPVGSEPSRELDRWLGHVLRKLNEAPVDLEPIDPESIEALRSLGYVD